MTKDLHSEPVRTDPVVRIDGHVDVLYEMLESHRDVSMDDLPDMAVTVDKIRRVELSAAVCALYCPDEYDGNGSKEFLSHLLAYAERYLTDLFHIKSAKDLNDCIRLKRPGMILLVENADCLLEFDRAKLSQAGIRVAGLTHMGRNRLGDGNAVPFPEGLSQQGKALVKELAREGFAFDAAHLAVPGFRDLVRLFEGPLLSSHTGVRALADIPRNLTRDQVAAIIERRGVIGIAADPKMLTLSGEACLEDIFHHIDWIAQSFGAGAIGIGTDFCGFEGVNAGFEDITRLSDLEQMMRDHGYPEQSIRAIMGENWRVFYESLLERKEQ
ncbi:MAG: membrane dipeptidase [Syntrophobacteraceae bacterium]|nr:membrane dipeptidase [Syntrophobacteraceae bacterium]